MGAAIGAGIASALIAKLIQKTAGALWGLHESDLEKKIAEAVESAYRDFIKAFPKGKAVRDTDILRKFFADTTLEKELLYFRTF